MKRFYLSGLLLMMSFLAFSQQKDPKAKALLDAVSNKFKSYSTVLANFSYQIQNSAGKTLSQKKGTINMKGSRYNIAFGNNKIISDGKTVWNYDPSAKEVTVNNANNSEKTITPQKLFTNFYDKDFAYSLSGEKTVGGKKVQEVVLLPTDKSKPFSKVLLYIDKAANSIISANVVEKNGNKYVYTVNSLKPNVAMSDAQFSFNKANYQGVEVVDLR